MKNYYVDMDGVIANFHKEPYKYANAINREWIANLEPFMENVEIVRNLVKTENVYILSKAANEDAKLGKLEWLARYIPGLNRNHIIIIVGNGKKVDYIRTKNGILIDDDMKNINPWRKAGFDYIYVEEKGAKINL